MPKFAWSLASLVFGLISISWFHGPQEPIEYLSWIHPLVGALGLVSGGIALWRKSYRPLAAVGVLVSAATPLLVVLFIFAAFNGGLVSH